MRGGRISELCDQVPDRGAQRNREGHAVEANRDFWDQHHTTSEVDTDDRLMGTALLSATGAAVQDILGRRLEIRECVSADDPGTQLLLGAAVVE